MKVRFYTLLVCLMGMLAVNAQDIHFSQFYSSPLTLNPAMTGNFNGFYRVSFIYRNQWPGLTGNSPAFSTPSVGIDFSLLKDKIKHGALGAGLVFVNDQQNGKTFNQNQLLLSLAYNMSFGAKSQFQIGLGLQGGLVMNKLDFSKFTFADSYNADLTYNAQLNPESYSSGTKMKGAFNAGLFAKYDFYKGMRVYLGYAFNNATNYKQDFLTNSPTYKLPFRHTIHGGFEFDIKDKGVLIPGVLYMSQAKANEVNFGLTGGVHVIQDPAKRATLYLGLWNRLNTGNYTMIPKIGFEWKGFRAGFAYDVHLSQKYKGYDKVGNNGTVTGKGANLPQGFEITLSYIGNLFVPKEDNYLFNPRY